MAKKFDFGLPKPVKAKKKTTSARGVLTAAKVQPEVNAAIIRLEEYCVTSGRPGPYLQCSYFIEVGGSPCLRFYPPNMHAQTADDHIAYHCKSSLRYAAYMIRSVPEIEWMDEIRARSIKYTQERLERILDYAKRDQIEELKMYIEILMEEEGIISFADWKKINKENA